MEKAQGRGTKSPLESGSLLEETNVCLRSDLQIRLDRRCGDREDGERHGSKREEFGVHG
jgi:hypothetical protein